MFFPYFWIGYKIKTIHFKYKNRWFANAPNDLHVGWHGQQVQYLNASFHGVVIDNCTSPVLYVQTFCNVSNIYCCWLGSDKLTDFFQIYYWLAVYVKFENCLYCNKKIVTIVVDKHSYRRLTTRFCVKRSQVCCSTFIVDLQLDSV